MNLRIQRCSNLSISAAPAGEAGDSVSAEDARRAADLLRLIPPEAGFYRAFASPSARTFVFTRTR